MFRVMQCLLSQPIVQSIAFRPYFTGKLRDRIPESGHFGNRAIVPRVQIAIPFGQAERYDNESEPPITKDHKLIKTGLLLFGFIKFAILSPNYLLQDRHYKTTRGKEPCRRIAAARL
jgi:hypothetical protein